MQTKTMTRLATVTPDEAMKSVLAKFPGATIAAFSTFDAPEGESYRVTLKLAEFPPAKDEADDAPDAEPKDPFVEEDKDEKKDPLDLTDDKDSDDSEDKPKEPKMSEVMDLMKAIADKLGVPVPGEDHPLDDPTDPDPLAPDAMPDPAAPPAPHDAPLPPPVPEKGGMGAFASTQPHADTAKVAGRRSFVLERDDAGEANNATLLREAHELFPTFRVARIDREKKAAEGIALVAMVARKKG
jgi:hypothetical protein